MECIAQKELFIVLVEDNPGHARLAEKNLRRAHVSNQIKVCPDGQDAVDYLLCEGEYAGQSHTHPLLVLLDLNLPRLDGYQVLERLRADDRTKSLPVIILTTTSEPREVERCYALGCSLYITKPVDYAQFSDVIRKLGLFLSVVTVA